MGCLTDCVVDTVALVKYLEDDLPKSADKAFKDAEAGRAHLYLPEIALGEFIYVTLKGRLRVQDPRVEIEEAVDQILATSFVTLSHLSHSAWDILIGLDLHELHDRMIVADALDRNIPLITSDNELRTVEGLSTIWR